MPLLNLHVKTETLNRAQIICIELGIRDLSQLFDQMVEEMDWDIHYAARIKQALLDIQAGLKENAVEHTARPSPKVG